MKASVSQKPYAPEATGNMNVNMLVKFLWQDIFFLFHLLWTIWVLVWPLHHFFCTKSMFVHSIVPYHARFKRLKSVLVKKSSFYYHILIQHTGHENIQVPRNLKEHLSLTASPYLFLEEKKKICSVILGPRTLFFLALLIRK